MRTDEFSIPVLRLWGRVLVPLQGDVTDEIAAAMREEVLDAIHDTRARGLIIDISGLLTLDSHLCYVLSNIATAARLMGTPSVISGMNAHTAQTLESMGIQLKDVLTATTAEAALEILGVNVTLAEVEEREERAGLVDEIALASRRERDDSE